MTGKKKLTGIGAGIIAVAIAGAIYGNEAQKPGPEVTEIAQEITEYMQTDPTEAVIQTEGVEILYPVNPDNAEEPKGEGLALHPVNPDNGEKAGTTTEAIITPTAEPTPVPEVTEVPTPSSTPVPTQTATPTVEPTDTPEITKILTPTKVPELTKEPTLTPTKAPKPTQTPTPTVVLKLTTTPEPTKVPTKEPTKVPTKVPTATPEPTPTSTDPHYGKEWGHQERLVRRTDIEAILFRKVNALRVANGLPPAENPYDFATYNPITGEHHGDILLRRGIEIASRNAKEHRSDHIQNQIGVYRYPFNGDDTAEYIAQYLLDLWCKSPNHLGNLLTDITAEGMFPDERLLFQFVVYDYCEFNGYDDDKGDTWGVHHSVAAICGFGNATEDKRIKK